jgi:circadian clock protein KaiC
VCGGAGCGKTIFSIEFLAHGAIDYNEPGVYLSFEETREKLARNVASLGIDLESLVRQKKIYIDYVQTDPSHIEETGEFSLDGLFIRLEHAIKAVKAKRVVLDSMDAIFGGFTNMAILRAELRRLFRWLESKGVTSVITGEKGDHPYSRYGLEEYVADCVIFLDHRTEEQLSTRRLRILKYRGTHHATNEFPFLIEDTGISVFPITALGLSHPASKVRISTGIPSLDEMFGGKGFFRGSTILVSGTAGTGKSSIAGYFAHGACARGGKALYFAFEESREQIIRNMQSIGLDLTQCVKNGQLRIESQRPTLQGLEAHLARMQSLVAELKPSVVVVDPITNFLTLGSKSDVKSMLMRMIDYLKANEITAMFTSLTEGGTPMEQTDVGVSSLIDTWLLLRDIELAGERNRGLYVLKSRGMSHSNQIREFLISDEGLELVPVYVGPEGILIGSARVSKENEERYAAKMLPASIKRRQATLDQKRKSMEAQIAAIRATYEAEEQDFNNTLEKEKLLAKGAGREAELEHRRRTA